MKKNYEEIKKVVSENIRSMLKIPITVENILLENINGDVLVTSIQKTKDELEDQFASLLFKNLETFARPMFERLKNIDDYIIKNLLPASSHYLKDNKDLIGERAKQDIYTWCLKNWRSAMSSDLDRNLHYQATYICTNSHEVTRDVTSYPIFIEYEDFIIFIYYYIND